MTCKAGRELLRKLVFPTVAAFALLLCTALPARAQASHGQVDATIYSGANGNIYSCELNATSTPNKTGTWPVSKTNFSCTATLTSGTPVTGSVKSDGFATFEEDIPGFGTVTVGFSVVVEERSDGTAKVSAHI